MTISSQGSFSIPSITVKSLNLSGSTSSTNPKPVANRTPRDVSESIITEKNKAISGNVLNNASDPDGDPLSITSFTLAGKTYSAGEIVNLPGVGSLTIALNGSYSFIPTATFTGTVPLTRYSLSDGRGGTATSSLAIVVTPAKPTVDPCDCTPTKPFNDLNESVTTSEDTAINGNLLLNTSGASGPVSITKFLITGDITNYTPGSTATIAGKGELTINSDGTFTFVPVANYNGTVPLVTYTLTDGTSGDTSTLAITVKPVNDDFSDEDEVLSTPEDTTLSGSLLTGTSSPDGTISVTGFNIESTNYLAGNTATIAGKGALTINSDGSFTFVPFLNYNGPVPLATYTLTDGSSGDTSTLDITVTPVVDGFNDIDEVLSTPEDTTLVGNVLTTGNSSPDGPISVTGFNIESTNYLAGNTATIAGKGALTINSDGSFTFVPFLNYNGPVPLATYTLTDGSSGDTSTLTINVTPVADPPTIVEANTVTVYEMGLPTGSDPGDGKDLASSNFTIGDVDGLANIKSITIAGTVMNVPAGGLAALVGSPPVATPFGELTLVSYSESIPVFPLLPKGTFVYQYKLTTPVPNSAPGTPPDPDELIEQLELGVTDMQDKTTTTLFDVVIWDDLPLAKPDAAAALAGGTLNVNAANGTLANDVLGADGPKSGGAVIGVRTTGLDPTTPVSTGVGTSIIGTYGTLVLYSDGQYSYQSTSIPTIISEVDSFVYTIQDGDGDLSTTTLTLNQPRFIVGSSGADPGSGVDWQVGGGQGAIDGSNQADILIGDPGGSSLTNGSTANISFVLDRSGSMDENISFGSGTISRLAALQLSIKASLDSLYASSAANVRVQINSFSTTGDSGSVFNLTTAGLDNSVQLNLAKQAVDAIGTKERGATNYEAGLQSSLDWINKLPSAQGPLAGADVSNLVFVSDGEPNRALVGNSTLLSNNTSSLSTDNALNSVLGAYAGGGDSISEVGLIETKGFTIEAIGIHVDSSQLTNLSKVEGTGGSATNVESAEEMVEAIGTLAGGAVVQTVAGADLINGAGGDDLIYGDAPNTDKLALDKGLSLPEGSGWAVFAQLESVPAYAWNRSTTLAYIRNNPDEIGKESGRTGGNDIINGGAGKDVIYGQEGNDTINAGEGADQVIGGSGLDAIDLTESVAAQDLVRLDGITAAADRDSITGFSTTGAATDGLVLADANTSNTTLGLQLVDIITGATVSINTSSAGSGEGDVFRLIQDPGSDAILGSVTDGSQLLDALNPAAGTATLTASSAGGKGYLLAYDGGTTGNSNYTAYLYSFNAGIDSNIAANEISLIATVASVGLNGIGSSNLSLI